MKDTAQGLPIDDGFDPGDDNALQNAMLRSLEHTRDDQLARGEADQAAHTQEDIDALRAHMAHDHAHDHKDSIRDDLDVA